MASRAQATQNDGDEIITGDVLRHLRHCELRGNLPVYAPCTAFKLSFDWPQRLSLGVERSRGGRAAGGGRRVSYFEHDDNSMMMMVAIARVGVT